MSATFETSSDDGDGDESREQIRQQRFQKLGFRPQNEIFCNKLLPYADQLDDESQEMLTTIKNNLAKAVALREMKPSVGIYVNRLMA